MSSFKIVTPLSEIEKQVNANLAQSINTLLNSKKQEILSRAKSLAAKWISEQPEILSLNSSSVGSLAGQLGIPAGQSKSATDNIISSVSQSISVQLSKFNKDLSGGGIYIYFQPADFLNLLGLSSGHVNTGDTDLHWLEWLLLKGDSVIVANYQYNPVTGLGRSRLGNMVDGGSFRIPPEFSGTDSNNFITRALVGESQAKAIISIFKDVLGA